MRQELLMIAPRVETHRNLYKATDGKLLKEAISQFEESRWQTTEGVIFFDRKDMLGQVDQLSIQADLAAAKLSKKAKGKIGEVFEANTDLLVQFTAEDRLEIATNLKDLLGRRRRSQTRVVNNLFKQGYITAENVNVQEQRVETHQLAHSEFFQREENQHLLSVLETYEVDKRSKLLKQAEQRRGKEPLAIVAEEVKIQPRDEENRTRVFLDRVREFLDAKRKGVALVAAGTSLALVVATGGADWSPLLGAKLAEGAGLGVTTTVEPKLGTTPKPESTLIPSVVEKPAEIEVSPTPAATAKSPDVTSTATPKPEPSQNISTTVEFRNTATPTNTVITNTASMTETVVSHPTVTSTATSVANCIPTDLKGRLEYTGNHMSSHTVVGFFDNIAENPACPDNIYIQVYGSKQTVPEGPGWLESQKNVAIAPIAIPEKTTGNKVAFEVSNTSEFCFFQVDALRTGEKREPPRFNGEDMIDYVFVDNNAACAPAPATVTNTPVPQGPPPATETSTPPVEVPPVVATPTVQPPTPPAEQVPPKAPPSEKIPPITKLPKAGGVPFADYKVAVLAAGLSLMYVGNRLRRRFNNNYSWDS